MTSAIVTQKTRVQLAATLPANDSGWTTYAGLVPIRGQEGAGQVIGSMTLEWHAGLVSVPGTNSVAFQTLQDGIGDYARVQLSPDGGTTWNTIWTGIIQQQDTVPDGNSATPGGVQTFTVLGLASMLDMIFVNQGYVTGYATGSGASAQMFLSYCPLFNALPSKFNTTLGERSASTGILGDSTATAYQFDMVTPSSPWSAGDILKYLLVGYAQPQIPPNFTPVGPQWVLSDPLGVLNYIPDKLDFDGKSLLECINNLINPRRGSTWYLTVSGRTITINVLSTSLVGVTVGATTMPASTTTASLDTRGNPFVPMPTITQDSSSQFDVIEVHGNHPLVGISLTFTTDNTGSLQKGWDSSLEATYDNLKNQGPAYENLWRRYVLNTTWNGTQYSSTTVGLRNALRWTTAASSAGNIASFGVGGYTGVRAYDASAGQTNAPARMLKMEKFIPLPYADYTTTPSAGAVNMTDPLLAPLLYVIDGGVTTDITDDYDIEIEENPPAVVISGDMKNLTGFLTSTATLVVTIGVREADPLMASWQNADIHGTKWVSETPRILVRRLPYVEQWVALQGSVMGVNSTTGTGTAFTTLTSSLTVVDDTPKLFGWLAYLRAWYGSQSVVVSWTDHSQIDAGTGPGSYQPGCVLTTVNRGDAALTCGASITTRGWDFTDANWGTTYTTQRIIPDVDSVEGHARVNMIWKDQSERGFNA